MALPIVPLLAAAAALLVLGRKKSSSTGGEPGYAPGGGGPGGGPSGGSGVKTIHGITAAPVNGVAWGYCKPPAGSPKGTYAALGPNGECVVFWRPRTWDTMRQIFQDEFSKLSSAQRQSICNLDECIPNPNAAAGEAELFCEWKPNPLRTSFIRRVVMKSFPQFGPEDLPAGKDDPYFPRMVWTFSSNLFSSEFCGIGRVT